MKILYLLSHPIQYFSPLLRLLNENEDIELIAYYCTDHTIKEGAVDKQFGAKVNWDIPLLEGYNYKFLKNISPKPALAGKTTGLINPGIVKALINEKPDYLIIHGWTYATHIVALFVAKILRIKVLMRSDSPLKQERVGKLKTLYKKVVLNRLSTAFLYVGEENKSFYKSYEISEKRLFHTPFAVENERFGEDYNCNYVNRSQYREELGISAGVLSILYSGKFIPKKRPMELLQALSDLKDREVFLIMLGTGELEEQMHAYIKSQGLENITLLPGFINQTQLYKYFVASDLFVLPSGIGETWGLVVNEAMNFHLPLIISDMVGCTEDLVHEGENGFTYPCGNVDELRKKIEYFLNNPDKLREMGDKSAVIIKDYSNANNVRGILKACSDLNYD